MPDPTPTVTPGPHDDLLACDRSDTGYEGPTVGELIRNPQDLSEESARAIEAMYRAVYARLATDQTAPATPGQWDDDLLDTVAIHVGWLRRGGCDDLRQAVTDNTQSADYLERLAAALRSQIAETDELLALLGKRLAQQHEVDRLTRELEARAAAPEPLWRGTTSAIFSFGEPAEGSVIDGPRLDVPPGTEVAVFSADQLPTTVTREQVAPAVARTLGETYLPGERNTLADYEAVTDAVMALLERKGSADGDEARPEEPADG
jgi:hypothetical protein